MTIRFANIANNAQVELRANIGGRRETKVTIAVTLESGDRKMAEFDSMTTLWDVIKGTVGQVPVEKGHSVVCVYMRKEVIGESELKSTTLRSLGLTSGRAAVRVFVREGDVLKGQAYVENLIMKRKAPEATFTPTVSRLGGNQSVAVSTELPRKEAKLDEPVIEREEQKASVVEAQAPEVPEVTKFEAKREREPIKATTSKISAIVPEPMEVQLEAEPEEVGSLEINWVCTCCSRIPSRNTKCLNHLALAGRTRRTHFQAF